jgi:hypothetical protein
MNLFRKKQTNSNPAPKNNAVADSIAKAIINRQSTIAGYLDRKTQYWNGTSKLIALILFCLLFGGFSLYMLISAFNN